jgi:hypothetical protein
LQGHALSYSTLESHTFQLMPNPKIHKWLSTFIGSVAWTLKIAASLSNMQKAL